MSQSLSSSSSSLEAANIELPGDEEDSDNSERRASNLQHNNYPTMLRERLAEPGAGILAADESETDLMLLDDWKVTHNTEFDDDAPFLGDVVEPEAAAASTAARVQQTSAIDKAHNLAAPTVNSTDNSAVAAIGPSLSWSHPENDEQALEEVQTPTSKSAPCTPSKVRGRTLLYGFMQPVSILSKMSPNEKDERDIEAADAIAGTPTTIDSKDEEGPASESALEKVSPTAESSQLTDKQRKCRYCVCIGILLGLLLIALGTGLGLKNKQRMESSSLSDKSSSSNSTLSDDELVEPPYNSAPTKGFQTTQELYDAVDVYLARPMSSAIYDVAATYGYPINEWLVGNLTRFDNVFAASRSPNSVSFNEPLDKWNMSKAVSLAFMFEGALAFSQDLSAWDTSNVRNMTRSFANCQSFNKALDAWTVSRVVTMEGMFQLATSFNQPLADWNVSACENFSRMFFNATSFAQNLCLWGDTIDVNANVSLMFDGASSCPARSETLDLASGGPFCSYCGNLPGVEVPIELNTTSGMA
ncbi:hypothetical protein MPSEU_000559500 [Mayamaea pseudoterrestris]|nr:hypothetical protein MPSEU_000559500 [Mayamaea pseudoterrestris]